MCEFRTFDKQFIRLSIHVFFLSKFVDRRVRVAAIGNATNYLPYCMTKTTATNIIWYRDAANYSDIQVDFCLLRYRIILEKMSGQRRQNDQSSQWEKISLISHPDQTSIQLLLLQIMQWSPLQNVHVNRTSNISIK